MCYNIRNYANIDVSRPLIDMQGSTKIASSDHQRRGRISWISLTLTVTLTLTLIDSQTPRCAQLVLVERVMFPKFAYVIGVSFHYYVSCPILILKLQFRFYEGWRFVFHVVDIRARFFPTFIRLFRIHVIPYERLERASTIYSGKSIEYMKYILHVLRSHKKGWRR